MNLHKAPIFVVFLMIIVLSTISSSRANASFIYPSISEPIISATFSADFAGLVAHRTIAGTEVNMLQLIGFGGQPVLDLSDDFFGTSELLFGDTPQINQGPLETGVFSSQIPSSFFPELEQGLLGLWFLATDTNDGLFAIDYLSLAIETPSGIIESFIDSNDGFGISLPDGGMLSAPLPISIPIGATGTGFDEAISSKSHHQVPVPEPSTIILFFLGLVLLVKRQIRKNT